MNTKQKRILYLIMIISIFILNSCTYASMTGTVVDAETGKPIEGAVVFINWTMTKGVPGLTYGEDYKTVEAITGKEGKFRIFGVLNPLVDPPTIIVYKKGYVAWRNDFIFPDYKKRENFQWTNNYVFKLEHFKRYSHSRHILFLRGGLGLASTKLEEAYSWEDPLASREEDLARKRRETKKAGEYTEQEFWKEIVEELYP